MAKAPDRTPWDGIIMTDADTCFGKARIAGTRIYVDLLLGCVEGGMSIDDILDAYRGLPAISSRRHSGSLAIWWRPSAAGLKVIQTANQRLQRT